MILRPTRSGCLQWGSGFLLLLLLVSPVVPAEHPYPLLRESFDAELQGRLEQLIEELGYTSATRDKRLNIALVDLRDPNGPKVAAINGDEMIYAASLPKIAILLGAMVQVEEGEMELDGVQIPTLREIYEPVLQELNEYGITLREMTTTTYPGPC